MNSRELGGARQAGLTVAAVVLAVAAGMTAPAAATAEVADSVQGTPPS